jgi:hypothetical protein
VRDDSPTSMLHLLLILGIVFLSGCATPPPKPAPLPFAKYSQDDREIYQKVFEHMFARWTGGESDIHERFFLVLNDADAPADLLARYRQKSFDVHPGSAYRQGNGIKCSAGAIEHPSSTQARVFGGYLFGDVGGAWGTFELIQEWGIWRVQEWKPKVTP